MVKITIEDYKNFAFGFADVGTVFAYQDKLYIKVVPNNKESERAVNVVRLEDGHYSFFHDTVKITLVNELVAKV